MEPKGLVVLVELARFKTTGFSLGLNFSLIWSQREKGVTVMGVAAPKRSNGTSKFRGNSNWQRWYLKMYQNIKGFRTKARKTHLLLFYFSDLAKNATRLKRLSVLDRERLYDFLRIFNLKCLWSLHFWHWKISVFVPKIKLKILVFRDHKFKRFQRFFIHWIAYF